MEPREGYAWAEDKEHCEEYGRMLNADQQSQAAKKRAFRRWARLRRESLREIQVVDEIHDGRRAAKMGIDRIGQIMVMIHSGSRGLGHQVATDALTTMERAMARDGIANDPEKGARITA